MILKAKYILLNLIYILLYLLFAPFKVLASENNNYTLITVKPYANHDLKPRYKDLPLGINLFNNIPFEIFNEDSPKLLCTNATPLPLYPKEITFLTNISFSKEIFILLNGGNTFKSFLGKEVGQIILSFSNGASYTVKIKAGINIRDWILNDSKCIQQTTDPNVIEVWRGTTASGSGPVIIDMLHIYIPNEFLSSTLESITLKDTSLENVLSADPALQFFAISVKSYSPIVFLPGLGGSWNLGAMTTGQTVGPWVKTPFVKVYDNLKATLTSPEAGFKENVDYFEFYYDWRKNIDHLADDLNHYLNYTVLVDKSPNTKVRLLGHSLGGLVARAYVNKYGADKIEKVVTVASPHQGALGSYLAWEGGEINEERNWTNLAFELLLQTQKIPYPTKQTFIQQTMPSIKDLFPNFDFLKDSNGVTKPINILTIQNNYLQNLTDYPQLKEKLVTIYGEEIDPGKDSYEFYKVGTPSTIDKLLGLWPDGLPLSNETTPQGDLTVLSKSATLSGVLAQPKINDDHSGIIQNQSGLQTILDNLDLTGVSPITNSTVPEITPSLIFFLHSPAKIKVTTPDGEAGWNVVNPISKVIYSDNDKLLVIPEALSGNYQVQLTGTGTGIYHLDVGQINEDKNQWQSIKGKIRSDQVIDLNFNFDLQNPLAMPLQDPSAKTYLTLAKEQLEDLNNLTKINVSNLTTRGILQTNIQVIIKNLSQSLSFLNQSQYLNASQYNQQSLSLNYQLRTTINNYQKTGQLSSDNAVFFNNSLEETGKLLEAALIILYNKSNQSIPSTKALSYKTSIDQLLSKLNPQIISKASLGENKALGTTFKLGTDKYEEAKLLLNKSQYLSAYIKMMVVRLLFLETQNLLL